MNINNAIVSSLLGMLCLLVTACGGGDGGIEGTGARKMLNGTAAIGSPIANATVSLKDRAGNKRTAPTGADGRYEFDVSGLVEPYLLKVSVDVTRDLYAVSTTDGVVNIHPLSDVASRNWFAARGRNIDAEFSDDKAITDPPKESELSAIKDALRALLRIAYEQFGIGAEFDFDHTAFEANGQGFDRLLDHLAILIERNKITLTVSDPVTQIKGSVIIAFDLGDDLTQVDSVAPSMPTGLAAIAASASGTVVTWSSSQDNVGVAGYRIFRDGQEIATAPYPVYSDAGLARNTAYCYTVKAFDGSGNTTDSSAPVCATTLKGTAPSDVVAPNSSAAPGGGTYHAAQMVALGCDDGSGAGCAAIYYTVDGSEPTRDSSVYSQALSIITDTTVRYFAVDKADNSEPTKHSETYVIALPIAKPAQAPALALGYATKQLILSWNAVVGATYYQLFEDPDGVSGYTQIGGNLTVLAYDHSIALHRRVNARYLVKACNSAGCTTSSEVLVSANLKSAIGYVKATNTGADDYFGYGVALSGDGNTLAVAATNTCCSAPGEDSAATGVNGDQTDNSASGAGAVYIYTRDTTGTWVAQAYVKATNTQANDYFGISLALSHDGNTLAVGAYGEDGGIAGINGDQSSNGIRDSGAVYVYTRNNGAWAPQAYVKSSNPSVHNGWSDNFGIALALSADGNTLAVGAIGEFSAATGVDGDQHATGVFNTGAVYVFVRGGTSWSQQAYVKATNSGDTVGSKSFGGSVSLSADGNTLAVGAVGEDTAATGVSGNSVYGCQTNTNCAIESGAVYVYARNGSIWSPQAFVKATNTGASDHFGDTVALSGDGNTLAVAATLEASNATTIGGDQTNNGAVRAGAVYVYTRNGGIWAPQAYVKAANNGHDLFFGSSLALNNDGSILAVGTPSESSSAVGVGGDPFKYVTASGQTGAVYVYARVNDAWSQLAYVKATNPGLYDSFGYSISMSADGNTLAVGATQEDSKATGVGGDQSDNSVVNSGAAYLY